MPWPRSTERSRQPCQSLRLSESNAPSRAALKPRLRKQRPGIGIDEAAQLLSLQCI